MQKGDIYFVNLPAPPGGMGHEQSGYRPGLVLLSDKTPPNCPMVIVVPFTKRQNARRFPYTIPIEPSPMNGLSEPSIALVFQIGSFGRERLTRLVGHLEDEYLHQIEHEILLMLDLK